MPIAPLTTITSTMASASALLQAVENPAVQKAEAQSASGAKNDAKALKAYQDFEAFVLQSFVESMLPKDAESVFGKGLAGGYWKSMLAEKLGAELAKTGSIGIAKMLASGAGAPAAPEKT